MSRLNKFLLGLLAVQIALAVIILTRGGGSTSFKEELILPGFDQNAVTRVQVFADGGKTAAIDVQKKGNDWVLANEFDYPVDVSKVGSTIGPLGKITSGEPVATSSSRHKQLKVADDDFDKKLIITANGKDTTLLVGSTAGLRRTAVRIAGEERVLGANGITAGGISSSPRDWIVKGYLDVPRDDVAKIEVTRDKGSFVLDRSAPPAPAGSGSGSGAGSGSGSGAGSGAGAPAPEWKVTIDGAPLVLAPGEKLEDYTIQTILSQAVQIEAMPADPKRDASKPKATVTLTKKDGKTVVYDILLEGDSQYWVKDRSSPRATKVDLTKLEAIMGANRSTLVVKDPAAAGSGSGSAAPKPPKKP